MTSFSPATRAPRLPAHRASLRRSLRSRALRALGGFLLGGGAWLGSDALAQTTTPQTAPACPLPANVAVTFLESNCSLVVLSQPTTFYRYFSSDSNRYGRYLTTDRFSVNTEVIRGLALNQEWGNQATRSLSVTVPAGTAVYQGVVAPQAPSACYPGGGQQTFIENSKDPQITWVEGPPLTVKPFSCP
ncbi:MAG: hypothetical protein ACKO22_05385 [Cyanobium sp.]